MTYYSEVTITITVTLLSYYSKIAFTITATLLSYNSKILSAAISQKESSNSYHTPDVMNPLSFLRHYDLLQNLG